MRIAEYKQIGTETVTNVVLVDDYNENGEFISKHEETITREIPVMGMVYRDATAEEIAESQKFELENLNKPAEISDEDKLRLVLDSIPVETPAQATTDDNGIINLPYKVGYRWEQTYNGNAFSWQLVADPNALGTAENPIYYVEGDEGIPLIDNAYYMVDGVRHVYMGGQFVEF